jgi:WD40 repeat protein
LLSFSPDGRLLAVGSKVHWVIRLWDVATQKVIRRLEHGLPSAVQFSPDGNQLASAAWTDAQVRIWEVADGKELRQIPINKRANSINCMAWSGDGKMLATWSYKDQIRLWNPDTGKQSRELNAGMDRIGSLVFSPDSKMLAAFGSESQRPDTAHILLWAADTGRLMHSLEMPIGSPYLSSDNHDRMAFSPDGRTLAVGSQRTEASIRLSMVRALETLERMGTPEARALCAALAEGVADAPLTREARATLKRMTR